MLRTVIKQFEMKNADEDEVLRLMPPPMRRSTIKFVYSDLVSKMLLFKGLNEAVTMEMLVALRMPRDSLLASGLHSSKSASNDRANRAAHVQKGELVVEEVRPNDTIAGAEFSSCTALSTIRPNAVAA